MIFQVWLTQVGQRFSAHGLDSHTATLLVAYLYQIKVLSPQSHYLSAFQMVIKFIAETDFGNSELDFSSTRTKIKPSECVPSFGSLMLPLEDGITVNLFWRISHSSFESLKHHARRSLSALQTGGEKSFNDVFMHRRDFFLEYNYFFHFPVPQTCMELSRFF